MPAAALVKGILLSLGVLAALGFAAYENPEVQRWIDEQRRRLADLLRGIGEELDPQSRREAEAFVMQGRPQPEAQPSASTTGASLPINTIRRIPVQGRMSEEDTEERQRLGREYLAARNQLLRVMRQRRDGTTSEEQTIQADVPVKEEIKQEMAEQVTPEDVATSSHTRSEAPPLPPKVKLEEVDPMPLYEAQDTPMPGSFEQAPPEMTYEEQIAHAISLSQQEAATKTAIDTYDDDVRRAVEASLREFSEQTHQHLPAAPMDLLSDDLPKTNVWQDEDLYTVTPNLTKATLAASQPADNPFEDESSTSSWTFDSLNESAVAGPSAVHADDSDEESPMVVTPDSWTEVGSLPDEEHEYRVPA